MAVTLFYHSEIIARGSVQSCLGMAKARGISVGDPHLRAFDDDTGFAVALQDVPSSAPRKRGRPALGVKAHEVTLLPTHWAWLATQKGGASATLRRLVEEAMHKGRSKQDCLDAAVRFLGAMAGDTPGYEEAVHALYLGDRENFDALCVLWPAAVAAYARQLAWPQDEGRTTGPASVRAGRTQWDTY